MAAPERRRTTALAAGLWSLGVAALVMQAVLDARLQAAGFPADYYPGWEADLASWVWLGVFITMGALVAAQRPGNPIGWLLLVTGLCFINLGAAGAWGAYGIFADPGWPGARFAAWLSDVGFTMPVLLILVVLVLFPDGRLPSPPWRVVPWLLVVLLGISVITSGFAPGPLVNWQTDAGIDLPNPYGIRALPRGLIDLLNGIALAVTPLLILVCAAPLVLRFRRARGSEREQLKWLGFGTVVAVTGLIGGFLFSEQLGQQLGLVLILPLVAIPVSIAVAILRHKLWDIDRILNRTLVYGLVTVMLAAVYAIGVLVVGQAVSPDGEAPGLVVAATTLAVAAVFQPLRRTIQRVVDRRFNRRRYDAARTIDEFAGRLRQQVDLSSVTRDLVGVADATVQPVSVSLWLRPGGPR
jgi:hypothetical protein